MPSIITVEQFRAMYPGLSSTDEQIQAVLDAVSESIRIYCGWHVAPSMALEYIGEGEGRLLMLPAMGVSAVESLEINGEEVTDFEWTAAGMVRLTRGEFPDAWRSVTCRFTAGFAGADVAQVAGQIAANALVAAPGVSSESAGNVSISYNKTGDGITGGVSLLARDYSLLAPYVLKRAW